MKPALAFTVLFGAIATSASADESPAFKVIEVQQTGGFAGVNMTYRITPDGKFTRKSDRGTVEGQLDGKEAKTLSKAVAAIDWEKMPAELRDPKVADDFLYDMHIVIEKKTHRVVADGTSAGKHTQLKPILMTLVKIQRIPVKSPVSKPPQTPPGKSAPRSRSAPAETDEAIELERVEPGRFRPLTEPPCSYCSTQHRKGLILGEDRVLAWIRAAHNGGAIPLRQFLAGPRVINDTYGLFFYDPDGGYVAAYRKDYGYELYGWRNGVMVVRSKDGTLWSALTGLAFDGPKQGQRLERIPSLVTTWEHWMMLHPESTAYDLFDGKTYKVTALPTRMSDEAKRSMHKVDGRLQPLANVLGVEFSTANKAYALDQLPERACVLDRVGDQEIAVFWYAPTQTAVAFHRKLGKRTLTFYADDVSPESAPFKDKETGSRWTLAGRAVDGPLRGQELQWANSLQCRWYAWSAEYPETLLYESDK